MKVNNIPSFGRIIKITSDSQSDKNTSRVDKSIFEIGKILNSGKSNKYSKAQSNQIRQFFMGVLKDYNGKDGVIIRKSVEGDTVLISGKDAYKINRIQKRTKYIGEDNAESMINKEINNGLETDKNGKPECCIEFKTGHKLKSGFSIFNSLTYYRTKVIYGKNQDGTINKSSKKNADTIYNITCDEISVSI